VEQGKSEATQAKGPPVNAPEKGLIMKAISSRRKVSQFRKAAVELLETRMCMAGDSDLLSPVPASDPAGSGTVGLTASVGGAEGSVAASQFAASSAAQLPEFNLAQSLSDQAQRTTLAFDALAMMTGNLDAQSFFPPGKVADYTGFQYLRDNDPDDMGHNTSFLTRIANNVIYALTDSQFDQLKTLATNQLEQINLYGYKRFALMEAFRRLMDGDLPAGTTGLSLDAVKTASRELYQLDGQISFDRALLYANLIRSLSSSQLSYLDAMKGKGFNSWPDISNDQIKSRMQGLPQGTAVAVMTYASDLFSWYAGSLEADVYFCPERHGTYYGGFYIKDAPAVGHEGYSISEQLTATAGAALSDSSKGYVTQSQAAMISSLVDLQRNNLYAGSTNIVQTRTQIATLLRSLLTSTSSSDSVKAQVLALSQTYGNLDGENNYHYATVFANVYATLTAAQKANLTALRKSIMSGTYSDGTPFDYSVCTTPFLYSSVITDTSVIAPYINNTDSFFTKASVMPAPEIQVLLDTTDIPDNSGSLAFGTTRVGTAVSRTITVKNAGTSNLVLSAPIRVPSGFTVTSSFAKTSLTPGASTTFVVRMNATAAGSYNGTLSFTNNDSDETTYNFTLSGTVLAKPAIVTGTVWNDANSNTRRDLIEKGLGNWQVFADLNKNGKFDIGEPAALTAADGTYRLELDAGAYILRETLVQGWQASSPASAWHSITVKSGGTLAGKNFGNRLLPAAAPAALGRTTPPATMADQSAPLAAPPSPRTNNTATTSSLLAGAIVTASGKKSVTEYQTAVDAALAQDIL
jgi:hypothetical protein